jgi:hypothetical protein
MNRQSVGVANSTGNPDLRAHPASSRRGCHVVRNLKALDHSEPSTPSVRGPEETPQTREKA